MNRLSFIVAQWSGTTSLEIVPHIDGTSLIDLVADHERSAGYDPAGEYAGLVPDHYAFGDLATYFLGGGQGSQWRVDGHVWLLGCECGEVGCWPLQATIEATGDIVVWNRFGQPYREAWDYAGLGPFAFDRGQYDEALSELVRSVRTTR